MAINNDVINTRSMIFTLYGDYISHYGNEIWIGSLIRLFEEFGHNGQSVRAAISRMSKQGWIESRKEGNKSYYFLTERGEARIEEAANRIFKLQPLKWDGRWRMLMYNIPEVKRSVRDELRKELVWSGFGSMANSCWISPNNLEKELNAIIDKYHIQPYVHLFLADYNGPDEDKKLVETCWDIAEINSKYEQFIVTHRANFEIAKDRIADQKMTEAECFVERAKLVHEYRKFLFIDPGLPEELLPEKWLGTKASNLFSEYYKLLAEPASRFFESVFKEGNSLKRKSKAYNALDHELIPQTDS
ncbi:phenylacetic acid degradation operon negative regulatory protein PaaX [Oceanobacillus sp. FSL H7-0719]|uniref:phenylacetic acid degradation operon negative regulatory protein PaaX n=1 Tax=Oceanobacillus sp. FSL H7-0719 TaxID=2954507 RepID=UPI00324991D6